jgi:hypothetical protein
MSILTRIDGIPVFSTPSRAVTWGQQFGLTGYHTHMVLGQTGYMGGASHSEAMAALSGGPITPSTPSTPSTPTSGGGGSGMGGY